MPIYSNNAQVPLSVAVFLATDHYDYEPDTISATSLIKPLKQTILAKQVPAGENVVDISGLVKSRMGTAIHDGIEKAWLSHYKSAMKSLGHPQSVIDRVVVNPDPNGLPEGALPVYMEQRAYREIDGVKLSGKYDFVAEGRLEDFKSTSVYTFINGNKDEDYQLQGSIYRWLNPEIITQDHMAIQFLFTDWMPGRALADPKYPNSATKQHLIPLLSLDETEHFIKQKLAQHRQYANATEADLPPCSDKDLWRRDPVYKYYKNPQKMSRATKVFDTSAEAYGRQAEDGMVGVVVEIKGEAVACKYCAAFPICKQKDALIADGSLKL